MHSETDRIQHSLTNTIKIKAEMTKKTFKKLTGQIHVSVKTESLPNRYNCLMSAHVSQAFSIAHCTDSEDLPKKYS